MSAIKRHMEEEIGKIADKYGYPYDMVYDAVNYTEFDIDRVELMAKARVLLMYVDYCKKRDETIAAVDFERSCHERF